MNEAPQVIKIKVTDLSASELIGERPNTAVCYHESGELYAEDVDQHMAVLPEIDLPAVEITIDDLHDPEIPLTDDQENLKN